VSRLAALLAIFLPSRGRHAGLPDAPAVEDTVILPRVPPWSHDSEATRLDLSRHRPYVQPDSEDDAS
jgi:hypothetical protein